MVELIVVISIMVIVTGIASLSVSVMFSRDAQRAASLIDDELSDVRMMSMSKADVITMIIQTSADPKLNTIELWKTGDAAAFKTINIDKSVLISLKGSATVDPGNPIKIKFNKANGSVEEINDAAPAANGLYEIEVVSQTGNAKTVSVMLVANTGRHYIVK